VLMNFDAGASALNKPRSSRRREALIDFGFRISVWSNELPYVGCCLPGPDARFWSRGRFLFPRFPQKSTKVAVRDQLDVGRFVSAPREEIRNVRQVSDRVEVRRRLLTAKGAVEIGADASVTRVAGDLADMSDVVNDSLQL